MSNFEELDGEHPVLPQRFAGTIQVKNTSGRTVSADSQGNYMTPDSYAAVNPFDVTVMKQLGKGIFQLIEFSIDADDLSQKATVNKIPKKEKNRPESISVGGGRPPGKCCPTR
jgi:hypothetical protein